MKWIMRLAVAFLVAGAFFAGGPAYAVNGTFYIRTEACDGLDPVRGVPVGVLRVSNYQTAIGVTNINGIYSFTFTNVVDGEDIRITVTRGSLAVVVMCDVVIPPTLPDAPVLAFGPPTYDWPPDGFCDVTTEPDHKLHVKYQDQE